MESAEISENYLKAILGWRQTTGMVEVRQLPIYRRENRGAKGKRRTSAPSGGYFPSVHSGSHLKFPEVEYFQRRRFQLTTQPVVDVYADGEYVCPTPVEIAVASGVIWVIVPA